MVSQAMFWGLTNHSRKVGKKGKGKAGENNGRKVFRSGSFCGNSG